MQSINYDEIIPNNVRLSENRRLKRALESWQPAFLEWWKELGPTGFQAQEVYLRTAVSVDPKGWANFNFVRMPEYRWGIFLTPKDPDRKISFRDAKGQPVWQEVPGDLRGALRRLIVIQGDTEPASVEQQRHLGKTAPSLYDLRNLFQVNVEEGRHLWAMVYLLHAYFGREGREDAEEMLLRHSGDPDKPRLLGAFNELTPDWLSFFMFTFITDRDGKYQLGALAESGFDPLARTCRFMLTEEAHHLFVGESGVGRIIQRTCEEMVRNKTEDVRRYGVIDLPTIQKYLNFHFSVSVDLFGSELSTNGANAYTASLKGRFNEAKIEGDDHQLHDDSYEITGLEDGRLVNRTVSALSAINERLRDDYVRDVDAGVQRWNKIIERAGIDYRFKLPHRAFNREIGEFAGASIAPDGSVLSETDWRARRDTWLPTAEDRAFVSSLMTTGVYAPGRFANWISPPSRGINNQPVDFEYVRFN